MKSPGAPTDTSTSDAYQVWVSTYDTLSDTDRLLIRAHIASLRRLPAISIVMPVCDNLATAVTEAIASVRNQLYPCWELFIACDTSTQPNVATVLTAAARSDRRITLVRNQSPGLASTAANAALDLATGDYVAFLDDSGVLPEHALYEVAIEILAHPDVDVIYSDEDQLDDLNLRIAPRFKPGWSPELLRCQNMIGKLAVYRRTLVRQIGGMRPDFEESRDWDLALRATETTTTDRIRHIPAVLHHTRRIAHHSSPPAWCIQSVSVARRAVRDHLDRCGYRDASIAPAPGCPGWNHISYPCPDPLPLVSVIIPTRDRPELLQRTVEGVLFETDYAPIEVIVVDNGSVEAATMSLFRRLSVDSRVKIISYPGTFNYSALNNTGARHARGTILALLNNDLEVIEAGWLREMVSHAVRREVGAVGAKLLYPDGRVQHAGVVLGPNGYINHLMRFEDGEAPGYLGQLVLTRSLSAVTGACMVSRRDVFEEVGGLEEQLEVAFSDIDFCLHVRDHGYRVVWTPAARLYHLESATRGSDAAGEKLARAIRELRFMQRRWGNLLYDDPYHNPNVELQTRPATIPSPPRRQKPWILEPAHRVRRAGNSL